MSDIDGMGRDEIDARWRVYNAAKTLVSLTNERTLWYWLMFGGIPAVVSAVPATSGDKIPPGGTRLVLTNNDIGCVWISEDTGVQMEIKEWIFKGDPSRIELDHALCQFLASAHAIECGKVGVSYTKEKGLTVGRGFTCTG
jgi:hypothetical protein